MQGIKCFRLILAFTIIIVVTSPQGYAAPNQIELPPETAKLPESNLPGYNLATQKCMICHSVDYIRYQPPGMDQAQWTAEVAKMKHSYGASLSEAEIKSIGAYLAVVYGTAKSTDSKVLAVSLVHQSEAGVAQSKTAIDVQILLDSNGCLGCHAIDRKMIGPTFREIASKYQRDIESQSMLASSIQKGGTGKWGQTPMPPMVSLNDEQAKALAKFVLEQ